MVWLLRAVLIVAALAAAISVVSWFQTEPRPKATAAVASGSEGASTSPAAQNQAQADGRSQAQPSSTFERPTEDRIGAAGRPRDRTAANADDNAGDVEELDGGDARNSDLENRNADASDIGRPAAQNPLIRGLQQGIEAQEQIFEGEVGDDLSRQLLEADALLSAAKAQNRQAIRHVNRQQRVGLGYSPRLVLVVMQTAAPWLGDSPESWPTAVGSPLPHLRRMWAEGVWLPPGPPESLGQMHSDLLTGGAPPLARSRLTAALWQAGYDVGLTGDGRWWPTTSDDGVVSFVGFSDADEPVVPYPQAIVVNGAAARLPANAGGRQAMAVWDLFDQECQDYWRISNRPGQMLIVSLSDAIAPGAPALDAPPPDAAPMADLPASPHSAAARSAAAWRRLDRTLGRLTEAPGAQDRNLLVMLVLLPLPQADPTSPPMPGAQAIVRFPGRLPAAARGPEFRMQDVLPSLLELVAAARRPAAMTGRSRWIEWQRAASRDADPTSDASSEPTVTPAEDNSPAKNSTPAIGLTTPPPNASTPPAPR